MLLVVVDIDECAPGGIASSCNQPGGVCEGHLPDRKFLCTCQPGYELDASGTACNGLYEEHVCRLLTNKQTVLFAVLVFVTIETA